MESSFNSNIEPKILSFRTNFVKKIDVLESRVELVSEELLYIVNQGLQEGDQRDVLEDVLVAEVEGLALDQPPEEEAQAARTIA